MAISNKKNVIVVTGNDFRRLDDLTAAVHDKWVNADALQSNLHSGNLTIFLADTSLDCMAGRSSDLVVISGVKGIEVRDTERIQCYDVFDMYFNDKQLNMRFNIPLTVSIQLQDNFSVTFRGNAVDGIGTG